MANINKINSQGVNYDIEDTTARSNAATAQATAEAAQSTADAKVANVAFDATNKKITKTIGTTASDVVTFASSGDISVTASGSTLTIGHTELNQTVKGNGTAFGSNDAVDLVGGAGISATADTTNDKITFAHTNSVTAGTASEGGSARTLAYGGSFNIPSVTYDAQGHITAKGSTTLTLPSADEHNQKVKAGSVTFGADDVVDFVAGGAASVVGDATAKTITITAPADTNQKVKAGSVTFGNNDVVEIVGGAGLSATGSADDKTITLAHSNSVTAGTAGTTSAQTPSYGSTFNIPYVTYDAQGHVTGSGNSTVKIPASDNTNQTVGVGTTTFGANDVVKFIADGSASVSASATDKTITISATDAHVTAVGNHYTPAKSTTKSASGATGTAESTVQVITGIEMDAAGHVTGIVSGAATDTNTKVTAVGNHYTPSGGTASTPSSSGTATRGTTVVMTGITKDAAGHVTGVTGVTLPASDNTNQTVKVGETTFGVNDAVEFAVSGDATIAADATNKKITIGATNTKNTAGTTNKTAAKMYVVGATEQSANPQTYSNANVYIGTDNELYANGKKLAHYEDVAQAVIFRGTLGTDGTITALPQASVDTNGDLYKVITAGTYAAKDSTGTSESITAKVGDMFICGAVVVSSSTVYKWIYIPSGDEPSGTVTSVAINNNSQGTMTISGSPITSSGTIKISLADNYGDTKNPYASKTKNYVLAAPNGSAGAPSFRALVAADIPNLNLAKITDVTKTAAEVNAAFNYKGTLGTGGTITALPSTAGIGDAYKVITAGTYGGKYCKVGDFVVNTVATASGATFEVLAGPSSVDGTTLII